MQESGKATPAIQPQHGINFTSLLLERAAEHLTMSMEIMECLSANWGVERPQAPAMHNLARNKAEQIDPVDIKSLSEEIIFLRLQTTVSYLRSKEASPSGAPSSCED